MLKCSLELMETATSLVPPAAHPHTSSHVIHCIHKNIVYSCCNHDKLISTLLLFRARVVRRSTRWISAATPLPSRSCSSTGIQTPQYLWFSLCRPPTTSAHCQPHPAPPPACRGSPSRRPFIPPPTLPPPTAARTLSAQTTRWCCQNTTRCWRRHPPLPIYTWVSTGDVRFKFLVKAITCF